MVLVPTFTNIRLTGEVSGFAPAVSLWLRRRHSPQPAEPDTALVSTVPQRSCPLDEGHFIKDAPHTSPDPPGFELVDDEEALHHRFLFVHLPV